MIGLPPRELLVNSVVCGCEVQERGAKRKFFQHLCAFVRERYVFFTVGICVFFFYTAAPRSSRLPQMD